MTKKKKKNTMNVQHREKLRGQMIDAQTDKQVVFTAEKPLKQWWKFHEHEKSEGSVSSGCQHW